MKAYQSMILAISTITMALVIPISVVAADEGTVELPREKQDMLDAEKEHREQSVKAPKLDPEMARKQISKDSVPTGFLKGIVEDREVPAGTKKYKIANRWQDELEEGSILVYAGSLVDDPEQGVLFVESRAKDPKKQCMKAINSPDKAGMLKVIKREGNFLEITSEKGSTLRFDVLSQEWIK